MTADVQPDRYSLEAYDMDAPARQKHRVRRILITLAIACAVFVLAYGGYAIWDMVRYPDIADYEDRTVQLIGLTTEPVFISPAQLAQMDCTTVTVRSPDGYPGQAGVFEDVTCGYGPTLEDIVAQYGYTIDDFRRILVDCVDGYEMAILPHNTLEGEIYVCISDGKAALGDLIQPMRLILPDMEDDTWAYNLRSLTFELD